VLIFSISFEPIKLRVISFRLSQWFEFYVAEHLEPTRTTAKRLFALSRNRCAFPGCVLPIVEDSGTVTGIICHICGRKRGGPRFDPKQTDEQRHAYENLILMCARHSKVIDSEPRFYTVAKLQQFKAEHEQPTANELSASEGKKVDLLLADYRAIYIQAKQVVIEHLDEAVFTKAKTPTIAAPEGSIGSDLLRRNYTKYLIDRYNHFASRQPDRRNFAFPAVFKLIERRYRVRKWELVPLHHFEELCDELRAMIDRTWLASVNRSNGKRSYRSLHEYRIKYFENAGASQASR